MDQMKLQRIIISMKENNVPQLIVADPASICYLTGRMLNCGERMLALYLDVEGNHKFFIVCESVLVLQLNSFISFL